MIKLYGALLVVLLASVLVFIHDEYQMLTSSELGAFLVELLFFGVAFLISAIRSRPRPGRN